MKLHLLSDLHLPFANNIRLSAFGPHWDTHEVAMATHWDALVGEDDVVLVPGDISWAGTPSGVGPDLEWLAARPGEKWLSRGNHDRWWRTPARMSELLAGSTRAVHDSWAPFHGGIIASVMGATSPGDRYFNAYSARRWGSELKALRAVLAGLDEARERHSAAFAVLMMHYPPCFVDGRANELGLAIVESGVDLCVYGHLHQPAEWATAWNGRFGESEFRLGSGDALGFRPLALAQLAPFDLFPAVTPCALSFGTAERSSRPKP